MDKLIDRDTVGTKSSRGKQQSCVNNYIKMKLNITLEKKTVMYGKSCNMKKVQQKIKIAKCL